MNTNATQDETTRAAVESDVRHALTRPRALELSVLHGQELATGRQGAELLAAATPEQIVLDAEEAERTAMLLLAQSDALYGDARVMMRGMGLSQLRLAAMARALAKMQTETDKALGEGTPDRDQWARYHVTFGELGWGYVADTTRERGVGAALAAYLGGQTDQDVE